MRFFSRAVTGLFLTGITLGILIVAWAVVFDALQTRREQDAPAASARERVFSVEVAPLTFGPQTPVLAAFGDVRARHTLELRAQQEGTIIALAPGFEDGGIVETGQLLFRIDPAQTQSARDTANANLRDAENERAEAARAVDLVIEDVAAARLQADLRARALARQRDLFDRGVGSALAVETAELAAAAAEQAVVARHQALAQAEARLTLAETALDRRRIALADAERQLAQTQSHAPFSGVLTDVNVTQGRLVTRNERLATLIDPTVLEVAFRVSTAQYTRLLDADGNLPRLRAHIILEGLVDPGATIMAEGVLMREAGAVAEGQTGRLLFAHINDPSGLRTGDFVRVEVMEPSLPFAARLPAAAYGADGTILLVGQDDRLESATVSLLRRQGDNVLIGGAEHLNGREVVLTRAPVLGAGIRITPMRPVDAGTPPPSDTDAQTITLDPQRRARLIAFVEANGTIPTDIKRRLIDQLSADVVPVGVVARLERRMGS